jgi:hypothetical protein
MSIILTSNKSFDSWVEMMEDEVMATALLDRLLHHARVFNLDGESYRLKVRVENENFLDKSYLKSEFPFGKIDGGIPRCKSGKFLFPPYM